MLILAIWTIRTEIGSGRHENVVQLSTYQDEDLCGSVKWGDT